MSVQRAEATKVPVSSMCLFWQLQAERTDNHHEE